MAGGVGPTVESTLDRATNRRLGTSLLGLFPGADHFALRYDLTPAAPDAANCVLGSEFRIQNVPDMEVTVAFSGGHEAATVASMQKCPTYNPKTDDVWECLVPK